MTDYAPPEGSIPVLFEDTGYYIIEKPSGLLSVPGRGPEKADCVLSRLHHQGHQDALVTHRLDMETSGLMIFARDADSHRAFSRLFEQRQIGKTYHALVDGHLQQQQGEVNLPLRCDWPNRPKQIIDHDQGKQALTRYVVEAALDDGTSLVALYPVTGRSHQLRVHMLALGHVILGDALYAHPAALNKADRLCLHASTLSFIPPGEEKTRTFSSLAPFQRHQAEKNRV